MKTVTFLFLVLFITACSYGDFFINRINEGDNFINYYQFERNSEKKNKDLILLLEGSSMESVLGVKGKILPWSSVTSVYIFDKELSDSFDLIVPERINMEVGKNYDLDTNRLKEYTLDQRVSASVKCINEVLKKNEYENIYLIGFSEGGMILPKVYNLLPSKEKIKKILAISAGGYNWFEIIKETKNIEENYLRRRYSFMQKEPNSVKMYYGNPIIKWTSFMFYDPSLEYKDINIPVLILHGDKDMNVPIGSSRYLNSKLKEYGKTNFEYIELKDVDHNIYEHRKLFFEEIEKFIKK